MKLGRSRLTGASLLAACAAAAIAGFALLSCNLADPFAAYSGVDFIAGDDFSSSGWAIQYPSLSTAPTYAYLTYTPVSATAADTAAGLPSGGSDIHLLEIPNLMPNGDFQNTSLTGWSGSVTPSVISPPTSGTIDGNTLSYSLAPGQKLSYDLTAGLADLFPANAQYRILFSANSYDGTAVNFDYDNGTTSYLGSSPWMLTFGTTTVGTYSALVNFPESGTSSEITAPTSNNGYFTIGTVEGVTSTQTGDIDNLRVTRVDVLPYLHLAVPYGTPSATRPALVSGTYEFSLYARLEDAAQVTPTVANAFDADGISLGINSTRAEFPASSLSRTQWKKISVKTVIQVSASPLPTDTFVDLYVTPTEINNRDVGGLLISSPSLTYLPNG